MDPTWRGINLVVELGEERMSLSRKPVPPIRPDLLALFDRAELAKYLTSEELPGAGEEAAQ
jgi:succinate dehydrogenase / fumarate reductase, flavoprotein subunit